MSSISTAVSYFRGPHRNGGFPLTPPHKGYPPRKTHIRQTKPTRFLNRIASLQRTFCRFYILYFQQVLFGLKEIRRKSKGRQDFWCVLRALCVASGVTATQTLVLVGTRCESVQVIASDWRFWRVSTYLVMCFSVAAFLSWVLAVIGFRGWGEGPSFFR